MTNSIDAGSAPLIRSMTMQSVVLLGLAYLSPIASLAYFGIIARRSDGTPASSYVIALGAILLTARSYGALVVRYPVSGSAYSFARRAIGARTGFMVGWMILLDYLLSPMFIWLLAGSYMAELFPAVSRSAWIILLILASSAMNVVGLRFTQRINLVLMLVQAIVIAMFVGLCGTAVWHRSGPSGLLVMTPFHRDGVALTASLGGAAVAAFSFLGFDAVTTLTEETLDATRVIPRAVMAIGMIGGAIFIVAAFIMTLAHPSLAFGNIDAAALEIAADIGGASFSTLFLASMVISLLACALVAQASVSRLLFAMGRDGGLPGTLFGYLHPTRRTPVFSIAVSAFIGLFGIGLDVETSTSFINFGAFLAFGFVNVSLIYELILRPDSRRLPRLALAPPILGALCDFGLLMTLDRTAIAIGLCWLAAGAGYLCFRTNAADVTVPE